MAMQGAIAENPSGARPVGSTRNPLEISQTYNAEETFFAWLMRLPHGTTVAVAAQREIDRMNTIGMLSDEAERLRCLFQQALLPLPPSSRSRRRTRQ